MKYQISIEIDYGKNVVIMECPEVALKHQSEFDDKTIAKTLNIPSGLISEQVKRTIKELESAE